MLPARILTFRHVPRLRPKPLRRQSLPSRWTERVWLDDGRELVIRPIRPEDAEPLRHGFGLLSPDEIRLRFLHPMRELPAVMAQRLAQIDPRSEFALVAAEPLPAGQALIGGVVRAVIDTEGRRAEFAIIVSRFVGRQGLGRHLMRRLIRWARLKKLDALYGDVLEENSGMLDLAESLGFRRTHVRGDQGVVRITLELQTSAPARD
jgi:RimJ/RimL family protein N-acetyltransferase